MSTGKKSSQVPPQTRLIEDRPFGPLFDPPAAAEQCAEVQCGNSHIAHEPAPPAEPLAESGDEPASGSASEPGSVRRLGLPAETCDWLEDHGLPTVFALYDAAAQHRTSVRAVLDRTGLLAPEREAVLATLETAQQQPAPTGAKRKRRAKK